MNVVLVDTEKYTPNKIQEIIDNVKGSSEEDKWIFLPKDFGVLLDCSTEQLYSIRKYIDDAIRKKEIINNM